MKDALTLRQQSFHLRVLVYCSNSAAGNFLVNQRSRAGASALVQLSGLSPRLSYPLVQRASSITLLSYLQPAVSHCCKTHHRCLSVIVRARHFLQTTQPCSSVCRFCTPLAGSSWSEQLLKMPQTPSADVESSTSKSQLTLPHSNEPLKESVSLPSDTDQHLDHKSELNERNLAHEAALRRLNGVESNPEPGRKAPSSASIASTQPVLVREYSHSSPSSSGTKQMKMRRKRDSRGNQPSSEMPPMEKFSFQDILASIDPEVRGSIDKIAEICGRSRMSLADEYSSHLPPQGDYPMPSLQDHVDQVPSSRLEPVEEASSSHEDPTQDSRSARTRAARLSLVRSSARDHGDLSSAPVVGTSTVASSIKYSASQEGTERPEAQSSYLPQLLAWLTSSRVDPSRSPHSSRRDSGATNALHRVLGSSAETAMD